MKAAIIREPGVIVMDDLPDLGPLEEYQCLCRNRFASTCTGTDRKLIHNQTPWPNEYPAVLGHENVAEIVEVGSKVRNFATGDIVLRPVYVYPGEQRDGLHAAFGGFAEYGLITDAEAMRCDGLNDFNPYAAYQMKIPTAWKNNPSAVMFITLKETFSWLRKLTPLYGKHVGVIGAGAVGLFYMHLASLFCAREVTLLARHDRRFELAQKVGADHCINLAKTDKPVPTFDLLIDAAGVTSKIDEFMPWVKPDGTFAFYGLDQTFKASFQGFASGLHFAFHRSDEGSQLVHETCVSLVDKGLVDLSEFHSSIMPFNKVPLAYDMIDTGDEFKVVFQFEQQDNERHGSC